MKTLLALVNNPANSEGFIKYSAQMAQDMNHNLHLIHIQNPAIYTLSAGSAVATSQPVAGEIDMARMEEEKKYALRAIEEKVEKISNDISSDVKIEISGETGALETVVNEMVADGKADMLLLENQHEEGFWVTDTNAGLILKANCPGWLIPPKARYESFKKIVYSTDYNPRDISTIKNLIEITKNLSPEIIMLHLNDESDENVEKSGYKEKFADETGFDNISVKSVKHDKEKGLAENINDIAINMDANLIVILKENKNFFERIFTSSATKKVIKKARLPLLVYHEKEFE